jgi:hypothetical protein
MSEELKDHGLMASFELDCDFLLLTGLGAVSGLMK